MTPANGALTNRTDPAITVLFRPRIFWDEPPEQALRYRRVFQALWKSGILKRALVARRSNGERFFQTDLPMDVLDNFIQWEICNSRSIIIDLQTLSVSSPHSHCELIYGARLRAFLQEI